MFRAAACWRPECWRRDSDERHHRRRLGARRRARGPHRAGHRDQDLLLVPEPLRRRAQHQRVPGVPRPARQPAGAQPAGGGAGHPARRGPALRRPRRRSSTGRTTSTRTCRRTTRSASTTSRSTSAAGWSCRRVTASASPGPTSRRTPASPPTWAATPAAASTAASTASSTTTGPACPLLGDRVRARHPHGRPGPRLRGRAAGHPRGHRRVATPRWRKAPCGSTPTCRSGAPATPAFGTRCEIKNLNSVRSLGPGHRVRGPPPDRSARGGRDGAPGDPALGRGRRAHAHAAHEGRRRRLPLLPRARSRAAGARRSQWLASVRGALPAAAGRAPPAPGRRRRPRRPTTRRW